MTANPTQNQNKPKPKPAKKSSAAKTTLYVVYRIFRVLLVPALCLAALFVGLTIGYSTIGGGDAADVFKFSTWKHLYDLVFEGT